MLFKMPQVIQNPSYFPEVDFPEARHFSTEKDQQHLEKSSFFEPN